MQKNKQNRINIAYACNDNYVLPLCCAIKSVLTNLKNSGYFVCIHVLCSNTLSHKNKNLIKTIEDKSSKIDFVKVDDNLFSKFHLEKNTHFTRETYYRYLLPDLLENIDKVLYLDCDTVALNDISEIFNINIDDYYIAGVSDFSEYAFKKRLSLNKYCNAGMLLFNLKKMRQENMSEKLIKYTIEHHDTIPFQDQDVINVVFQEKILMLDNIWNTQLAYYSPYNDFTNNYLNNSAKILHFICEIKPWQYEYKSLYKLHFFKYFYMLPQNIQFLLLKFPPK